MRTVRAARVFVAIESGAQKMRRRILTGAVDVVVLVVVAHAVRW